MRSALLRSAVIGVVATGAAFGGSAPAHAAEAWVQLNPTTVQAGFSVSVRASCGDNANPAKIQSTAFGPEFLMPKNGVLSGVVTVPPDTKPGNFNVRLDCINGAVATANLRVLAMAAPVRGPDTGGGALAQRDDTGASVFIGGVVIVLGVYLYFKRRQRAAQAEQQKQGGR